jgi:hypothetical protein
MCLLNILTSTRSPTRQYILALILLTWTIWRAPTNASKWRMGFNSALKWLKCNILYQKYWNAWHINKLSILFTILNNILSSVANKYLCRFFIFFQRDYHGNLILLVLCTKHLNCMSEQFSIITRNMDFVKSIYLLIYLQFILRGSQ